MEILRSVKMGKLFIYVPPLRFATWIIAVFNGILIAFQQCDYFSKASPELTDLISYIKVSRIKGRNLGRNTHKTLMNILSCDIKSLH